MINGLEGGRRHSQFRADSRQPAYFGPGKEPRALARDSDDSSNGDQNTMKNPHPLSAGACALVLAGAGLGLAFTAAAQTSGGMNAFPNAGQSQEQQSRDRFECHQWAVQQSGFDPTMAAPLPPPQQYSAAPPPPPPPPRQQQSSGGGLLGFGGGGLFQGTGSLGDAASGAALGAAGGALAGDAGKGAAIGAGAGLLLGLLNKGGQQQQQPSQSEQDYYYQQQQQQYYQQQQQAQQSQAYMQRQEQTESYRRAFGACMTSRNYYVQ